jgi:ATP-dependent DNA helicase RecQ
MTDIRQVLKEYWGYDAFRPMQEDIINAVLAGNDALALLPTGGGKSICFQVPAMAKEGICLVISPLIALMKDQVQNLQKKGILALSIYSGMSFIEVRKTLQNAAYGNYKFLYVSPERLQTDLFLEFLPIMKINLIAVDEAHCISQWGYDFRPPYLRIAELRAYLPNIPVLALTASATKKVQDDICEKLAFTSKQQRFQQSFERANLSYSAFNVPSRQNKLLEILQNVKGSAIVYCKSRKHTKDVAGLLNLNGIKADFYHAGLSNEERSKRQESWINNATRIMVCTNAFGMGIDKPNVRVVVHYGVPDCLENYYQEAGRAGRDGKRAYAVLMYNDRELDELLDQTALRFPDREAIKNVYIAIMNALQIPAGYGEGNSYDFDLVSFANAFKINILTATYAIKTLEQEGLMLFTEALFKPSTVVFHCDKNLLTEFEQQYPAAEPILKGLLRSYEGIFDFPAAINEAQLGKFIGKSSESIIKQLTRLAQLGIIEYNKQKDGPQITLLLSRMYADSFMINLDNYLTRKKLFEERVKVMVNFTKNKTACRSQLVAAYFNDNNVKHCGICDNCIELKNTPVTISDFDSIVTSIYTSITNKTISIKELLANTTKIEKEKRWTVINYLQAEEKIVITADGYLQLKG